MAENEAETNVEEKEQEPEIERLGREDFLRILDIDSNPLNDLKWVFQALGAKNLIPSDAPSPGAWYLLQSLSQNEIFLRNFYSTVFTRLAPTKAQLDREDARSRDRGERLGLVERLLLEPFDDAPVLSDTERRARELAVSKKDS